MSDPIPIPGPEDTWVKHVQLGAEIAVAVGTGVLAVLDALDRHNQLQEDQAAPDLLTAPASSDKETP